MRTIKGIFKKHLVRGIFMGMFAILLFRAGAADAAALTQNCGQWNVVPSPAPGSLLGVAVVSANDVWTVGAYGNSPIIEHWDGSQWSIVPSPMSYPIEILLAVAAHAANDVWATGYFLNPNTNSYQTLIEHWDGTQWSIVPSPNPQANPPSLGGVVAISANDVWAVGGAGYYPNNVPLTEHWDGTQWTIVPSPAGKQGGLGSVTAVSSNDIWAVGGNYGGAGSFFLHWDGTQWNYVPNPALQLCGELNSVSAIATNDVWAVGYSCHKHIMHVATEHWDGTQWSIVQSPKFKGMNDELSGVSALSTNDIWAVGTIRARVKHSITQTLTEHWNGSTWSVVPSPDPAPQDNGLNKVSVISSTDVWAVGGTSQGTLTLNYAC